MATAMRTIKVFCEAEDRSALSAQHDVLEIYESFLLLSVTEKDSQRLARTYPVEDISDHFTITLPGRRINTKRPRVDLDGRTCPHPAYKGARRLPAGRHHYIVQFIGPIREKWLRALKQLKAEPRAPLQNYAYLVRCDGAALKRVVSQPHVRWVGHLSHRDRLHVRAKGRGLPRTRTLSGTYQLEFFDQRDLRRGIAAIRRAGADIAGRDENAGVVHVCIGQRGAGRERVLERLSSIHGVRAIRLRTLKRPSNNVATALMNTTRSLQAPLRLSGKGELIAICDTGLDTGRASDIHRDFHGRIHAIRSYPITATFRRWIRNPEADDGAADLDSGHGTHVAGSALGSGVASRRLDVSSPLRGLAFQSKLVFQAVEQELHWRSQQDELELGRYLLAGIPDDLRSLFRYAYRKGARTHSNSWGGGQPGEYDAHCAQLDEFIWKNQDFCVLVAAGNDGTDADGDGHINQKSITSPATAKNCITVGACESVRPQFDRERYGDWWPDDYPVSPYRAAPMANNPDQIAAFSSRGPTEDGRIKPDVVAPGTFILSTRSRRISPSNTGWAPFPPSKAYFYMGGTSMATPLTAGAVALLREFFRDWVGLGAPSAALIKASLIGGASKLGRYSSARVVHDVHQGYGLVDLDAIVDPPGQTNVYFHDDDTGLRTGQAHDFEFRVRSRARPFRVAMAYSDYPGPALVNNLNLILEAPSGRTYVGNAEKTAPLKPDTRNNAEVVHIPRPALGRWKLRVVGSNVPHGPQRYALMISGRITS
jgi:hypothetical protein